MSDAAQRALLARENASSIAESHRRTWETKPILREVYGDFYRRMASLMSPLPGPSIELGGGPGTLKTYLPHVLSSDIAASQYLDFVADAVRMPLASGSVANILMVDVLHHLAYPRRFFEEVSRVLMPGGRLIVLDVFLSPASYPLFHWLHPEPATLSVRPLDADRDTPLFDAGDPWNSDQGIARAIFWKQCRVFAERFPNLHVRHRSCLSTLLWPLSGGFEQKNRLPGWAVPIVRRLDRALELLGRLAAYRCLVAVEKTAVAAPARCSVKQPAGVLSHDVPVVVTA